MLVFLWVVDLHFFFFFVLLDAAWAVTAFFHRWIFIFVLGAVLVVLLPLFCFERAQGFKAKMKKLYKTSGGSEVSHRIMIATCSFLHRNQPFFYDWRIFPTPPEKKETCIAYYIFIYIQEMAKHDNWEAKRVLCVVIL